MCCINFAEQKFGRILVDSGTTNDQKSFNGFDRSVYYPTNWRNSGYNPQMGKFPNFNSYSSSVATSPEYYGKNYLGIYPIRQQPVINEPQPYEKLRYS